MPRRARVVVPGVGHHVTQRGTGRQIVFYTRADRAVYLRLLKENSERARVRILAYCLMPNHIHVVAVPDAEDSLAVALRRTHGRYAQYLNARRVRSGHLWAAIRYVERNPVRAAMVASAEEYEWSSAAAHLTGADPRFVLDLDFWAESGGRQRWAALLAGADEEEQMKLLIQATHTGNPLGSKEFQEQIRALRAQREAARRGEGLGFGDEPYPSAELRFAAV